MLPSGAVLLLYYGPAAVPAGDVSPGGDGPRGGDASPETAARAAATASSLLAAPALGGAADLADRVGPEVLAALTPGRGAGPATVLAALPAPAPAGGWSMDLPADPLALRGLRTRLRDWLRELGASASDRTDVELAVWEAAVNAIVHGRPATGPASITVRTSAGRHRAGGDPGERPRTVAAAATPGHRPEVAGRTGAAGHQAGRRRTGHRPGPGRDHGDPAPEPQPPASGAGPARGVSRDCCTSR